MVEKAVEVGGSAFKEEYLRRLERLENEFKEHRARDEERERLINRFWLERAVYIGIIAGIATALVMIMV